MQTASEAQSPGPLEKRDAALTIIRDCERTLGEATPGADIRSVLQEIRRRIDALQGSEGDRPYFARTLCRLANALRHYGWPEDAIDLLEWGVGRGAIDAYMFSELVECHIKRNDCRRAEDTLLRARTLALAGYAIYTSVLSAYGRIGEWRDAQRVFELALGDDLVNGFTITAMIHTYGKAGELERARAVFETARARGMLIAGAYTALLAAYGRSGKLEQAQLLFQQARALGVVDVRSYTVLLGAYTAARRFRQARALFEDATSTDHADSRTYTTLMIGYALAGRTRDALGMFDRARVAGRLTEGACAALVAAFVRGRYYRSAGDVVRQARAVGFLNQLSMHARVNGGRRRLILSMPQASGSAVSAPRTN